MGVFVVTSKRLNVRAVGIPCVPVVPTTWAAPKPPCPFPPLALFTLTVTVPNWPQSKVSMLWPLATPEANTAAEPTPRAATANAAITEAPARARYLEIVAALLPCNCAVDADTAGRRQSRSWRSNYAMGFVSHQVAIFRRPLARELFHGPRVKQRKYAADSS